VSTTTFFPIGFNACGRGGMVAPRAHEGRGKNPVLYDGEDGASCAVGGNKSLGSSCIMPVRSSASTGFAAANDKRTSIDTTWEKVARSKEGISFHSFFATGEFVLAGDLFSRFS
jgi:hypothetical protein